MFIVIDGTDGSGKTVQAQLLTERLQNAGRLVEMADFPQYGKPSAYFVERYLRGEYGSAEEVNAYAASVLYAVDRFDAGHVRSHLEKGAIVISNRYVASNKGHQMGKIHNPDEQVRFVTWLNDFEYGILGIPKPDLTILLHVTADISSELARKRDEAAGKTIDIHQANIEHLRAAERAYLRVPEIDNTENWRVVECVEDDRLLSIDAIHQKVWQLIEPMLK